MTRINRLLAFVLLAIIVNGCQKAPSKPSFAAAPTYWQVQPGIYVPCNGIKPFLPFVNTPGDGQTYYLGGDVNANIAHPNLYGLNIDAIYFDHAHAFYDAQGFIIPVACENCPPNWFPVPADASQLCTQWLSPLYGNTTTCPSGRTPAQYTTAFMGTDVWLQSYKVYKPYIDAACNGIPLTPTSPPRSPTAGPSPIPRTSTPACCSPCAPGEPLPPCQSPTPNRTQSRTPTRTSTPLPGGCQANATTLCLDSHFAVKAMWTKADGTTGAAQAIPRTVDTGEFWFFDSTNIEMVVKALDGCAINTHEWVFMGGLTNVQVATTVMDSTTGAIKTYQNPQGVAFQPVQDTSAFPCPASRHAGLVPYHDGMTLGPGQTTLLTAQGGYVNTAPTKPCNCTLIDKMGKNPLPSMLGLIAVTFICYLLYRSGNVKRTM